jgi:hypothetical protein
MMFTTLHRAGVALALIVPPLVGAASAQTTPRAFLEQATPSGAANSFTLYRVPVVTSTGAVVYKDVQIQFNVSAAGALTLKPGFPVIANSAVLLTGNFLPGRYKLGVNKFVLSGPGVAAGGRTSWSIDDESGAGSCLKSAGWTSGPVSGHPFQRRLTTAGITYAGYSYGVLGDVGCSGDGIPSFWREGDLVGAAATATGLTIFRYTDNSRVDHAAPVDSASFQRCPATGNC